YKQYEGKTVLELAQKEGVKPIDMYLKLVDLSNQAGSIYLGKYYNDAIVKRLMEDDLSVFMTDAWVEDKGLQNIAAFQTFPQFFLLAKRYGMPYERIVRKMTGATADRYRLENRGYLKEGYKADITILDVDKLKVNEAIPDFTPEGIEYVYINGSPIVEEGKYLSVKAGELILRKGYKETEEETKQSPASKRKILRKVVRV
ncbi:MAG: amidohydrolase family protein, partial [Erysipelotrichaceae bacterium]|nr:amidohydrolase family protein [Erysipelotrichaceae bacterium]